MLKKASTTGLEKIDEPDPIFQREWDNLIILDACRYDLYQEVINSNADFRYSVASCTSGYTRKTYSEGKFEELIYVSGNPHQSDVMMKELTGRENPFFMKYRTFNHGWDSEKKTVLPKAVVSDAISAEKLYPNKKKIVHFNQPHHPFIGGDMVFGGLKNTQAIKGANNSEEGTVWDKAIQGKINKKEIWNAYSKNLEMVFEHVKDLKNEINGKTVVTADHGNYLGENGLWGHPGEHKTEILRKVPWDVISEN